MAKDRPEASSARQLALVAGAVAAIAVVLVGAYMTVLRPDYRPLYTNLRSGDAAAVVDALEKAKTPHRLADGGATVLVPADALDASRVKMAGADPSQRGLVGFEIFNKSDMGLTEFAQRINYQRALQGELARTILTLDGVEAVRVHVSLGETGAFRAERAAPKASVSITPAAGRTLSPAFIAGVRALVAAAVPDLDPSAVVILDAHGGLLEAPPEAQAPQTPETQTAAIIAHYESLVARAVARADARSALKVTVRVIANGAASGAWTPDRRAFPLDLTLSGPAALDDAARQTLQRAALGAIAPRVEGDRIAFALTPAPGSDVATGAAPASAAAAAPTTTLAATRATGPSPTAAAAVRADGAPGDAARAVALIATLGQQSWIAAGGLAAVLLLAFAAWALPRRARKLSVRAQEDLANALKALIRKEEAHVTA